MDRLRSLSSPSGGRCLNGGAGVLSAASADDVAGPENDGGGDDDATGGVSPALTMGAAIRRNIRTASACKS